MSLYSHISANKWKTFFYFVLFGIVFTGLFYLIGIYMENPTVYLVLGILISLGSSFFSYFFSDKIVLATVHAMPADRDTFFDLYTVTENLAMAAGLPKPKIYVIEDDAPNAFATGRDPKHAVVCATTGLLKTLNRGELEGVIAHELAHVQNYDILVMSIVSVLVGTLAIVTDFVMRSMWWGGGDDDNRGKNPIMLVLLIVALILTPIVATLIQLAISRRREFLADASGSLITRNPEGLASALEKISSFPHGVYSATTSTAHLFIENPLRNTDEASWLQKLFSTHPPAAERIKILRSM